MGRTSDVRTRDASSPYADALAATGTSAHLLADKSLNGRATARRANIHAGLDTLPFRQ